MAVIVSVSMCYMWAKCAHIAMHFKPDFKCNIIRDVQRLFKNCCFLITLFHCFTVVKIL